MEFTDNLLANGFFKKAFQKESCEEIINIALCIPGIHVLGVGPESCLRVLYFRALKQGQNDRFHMLGISNDDMVTGKHIDLTKIALQEIMSYKSDNVKAVIIYLSCSDILQGSNLENVISVIEKKYQRPVRLLKRGPLTKRRILPKERLGNLFCEILDKYVNEAYVKEKGNKSAVNILGEEKLSAQCELFKLLKEKGFDQIQEFTGFERFDQFMDLINGRFSVVTHKFALNIAEYLEKSYGIPYCFVSSKYRMKDIESNYRILSESLNVELNYREASNNFRTMLDSVKRDVFNKKIAVGLGERTFEIAGALAELGFCIQAVFVDTVTSTEKKLINFLFRQNKDMRLFSIPSINPVQYESEFNQIDIAIGERAIHYCSNAKKVQHKEVYGVGFENISRLVGEIL
ncbi:MAG: hypothetical protein JG781_2369 [Peptococcaceae bacterium]|jgi:nitrogenase molybdenum-iron protein alpha/beta subunit|nr:hypothetical protein [Peptococcaceae bacterium]